MSLSIEAWVDYNKSESIPLGNDSCNKPLTFSWICQNYSCPKHFMPSHPDYPKEIHFYMKLYISLKIKDVYNPFHKINVIPHSVKKYYGSKTSAWKAATVGQAFYRIKHFCPWSSKITVTNGEELTQGFKFPSVTSIYIEYLHRTTHRITTSNFAGSLIWKNIILWTPLMSCLYKKNQSKRLIVSSILIGRSKFYFWSRNHDQFAQKATPGCEGVDQHFKDIEIKSRSY